jgi:hypothetical protein
MRPRIPSENKEHTLVETLEYCLTAALVIVVAVAVLQICGLYGG